MGIINTYDATQHCKEFSWGPTLGVEGDKLTLRVNFDPNSGDKPNNSPLTVLCQIGPISIFEGDIIEVLFQTKFFYTFTDNPEGTDSQTINLGRIIYISKDPSKTPLSDDDRFVQGLMSNYFSPQPGVEIQVPFSFAACRQIQAAGNYFVMIVVYAGGQNKKKTDYNLNIHGLEDTTFIITQYRFPPII